jgi:hypothetical protein
MRAAWDVTAGYTSAEYPGGEVTIELGTRGPSAVDTFARLGAFGVPAGLDERIDAAVRSRAPTTVLMAGDNGWGAPFIYIIQGRLSRPGSALFLVPTGSRTRGYTLIDPLRIIDILDATGPTAVDEMAQHWFDRTVLPLTRQMTADDLATARVGKPVALVTTHPGFGGGEVPGCIWLVSSVDGDVAWGYLWCPEAELCSEFGSIAVRDLLSSSALVTEQPSGSESDWLNLPTGTTDAYRALFPNRDA